MDETAEELSKVNGVLENSKQEWTTSRPIGPGKPGQPLGEATEGLSYCQARGQGRADK